MPGSSGVRTIRARRRTSRSSFTGAPRRRGRLQPDPSAGSSRFPCASPLSTYPAILNAFRALAAEQPAPETPLLWRRLGGGLAAQEVDEDLAVEQLDLHSALHFLGWGTQSDVLDLLALVLEEPDQLLRRDLAGVPVLAKLPDGVQELLGLLNRVEERHCLLGVVEHDREQLVFGLWPADYDHVIRRRIHTTTLLDAAARSPCKGVAGVYRMTLDVT